MLKVLLVIETLCEFRYLAPVLAQLALEHALIIGTSARSPALYAMQKHGIPFKVLQPKGHNLQGISLVVCGFPSKEHPLATSIAKKTRGSKRAQTLVFFQSSILPAEKPLLQEILPDRAAFISGEAAQQFLQKHRRLDHERLEIVGHPAYGPLEKKDRAMCKRNLGITKGETLICYHASAEASNSRDEYLPLIARWVEAHAGRRLVVTGEFIGQEVRDQKVQDVREFFFGELNGAMFEPVHNSPKALDAADIIITDAPDYAVMCSLQGTPTAFLTKGAIPDRASKILKRIKLLSIIRSRKDVSELDGMRTDTASLRAYRTSRDPHLQYLMDGKGGKRFVSFVCDAARTSRS